MWISYFSEYALTFWAVWPNMLVYGLSIQALQIQALLPKQFRKILFIELLQLQPL